jgi:hypothetical protein
VGSSVADTCVADTCVADTSVADTCIAEGVGRRAPLVEGGVAVNDGEFSRPKQPPKVRLRRIKVRITAFLKITVTIPDKSFAPRPWRENNFWAQIRFG